MRTSRPSDRNRPSRHSGTAIRGLPSVTAVTAVVAVTAAACAMPAAATGAPGPSVAFSIDDPRIAESSGLAVSRRHPGVYWTHNDSDDGPYVYGIDARTGRTVATVTLRGVHPRDVEAISVGPDGDVYVGDIGDNLGGTWPEVWIYRFHEPGKLGDTTVKPVRYTVRYDGGPRNAEALMVHPKTGRVYIASKNEDGGGLYAGPRKLSATGVNVFRRIAEVPWVTDGSFSPDGTRLVLRGYFWATDYRWTGGAPVKIGSLDVPMQPQGESVAYTADGRALMYGSEGARSEVWRAPLSGRDLPDSAVRQDATRKPAGDHGPAATAGAGGLADHRSSGDIGLGAAVLAGVAVLLVGLRRKVRRGG